jgi:hypothetical protein
MWAFILLWITLTAIIIHDKTETLKFKIIVWTVFTALSLFGVHITYSITEMINKIFIYLMLT